MLCLTQALIEPGRRHRVSDEQCAAKYSRETRRRRQSSDMTRSRASEWLAFLDAERTKEDVMRKLDARTIADSSAVK
jgi:hypothetical protein